MRRLLKKIGYIMSFSLLLFFGGTILLPYLLFLTRNSADSTVKAHNVQVIAHRGASGHAPENTLSAIELAIKMDADMVEIDVHLSKDDSIVVMHDEEVGRTTDGKGKIKDLTYEELRQLDAGSWFSEAYRGERVPTLAEVLRLVDGRKKVLIELKSSKGETYDRLVERVAKTIKQEKAEAWTILQSFDKPYLRDVERMGVGLPVHQLIFGEAGLLPVYYDDGPRIGKFRPEPYVASVNAFYLYITPAYLKKMHSLQKTVFAFTPNDDVKMKKLINMGVDGLITNYPDVARNVLGRD